MKAHRDDAFAFIRERGGDAFHAGAQQGPKAWVFRWHRDLLGQVTPIWNGVSGAREVVTSSHVNHRRFCSRSGLPLSFRAAIKPISTQTKPRRWGEPETQEPAQALRERTDSTVVPAAAVVAEAMVALMLARCYREKFGGDHIDDVLAAVGAYKQRIDFRG